MKKEQDYNVGFIRPDITPDNYIMLGGLTSLPKQILRPDGDWTNYLVSFESQLHKNYDTFGCTIESQLTCLEILEKFITGKESNYAERYNYNLCYIVPPGANPQDGIESMRKQGVISEETLPDTVDTLAEYSTPRPMSVDYLVKGQHYLNKWQVGHEWLWAFAPKQEERIRQMKEALLYSPLAISVTAWYKNDKGLYYSPQGLSNGHFTCCYKIDETGIYVFDSYENDGTFLKKLTLDHNIQYAKRYSLTVVDQAKKSFWFMEILRNIGIALGLIQKEINVLVKEATTMPPEAPKIAVVDSKVETPSKYLWDTKENVRKSIRIIADEEKLTLLQKDLLCDICNFESGFNPKAKLINSPKSIDRGLFQWNSYWHKEITDEIAYDPELNARLACKAIKDKKVKVYWNASKKYWNKSGKYDKII